LGNPANRNRSVSLTAAQFRYAFGNALWERESAQLYEAWNIPAPGRPVFEAAFANLLPHSPAKVNTRNSARGPLLLISGQKDHTVPDIVTHATFSQYRHSTAVTDLRRLAGRGHCRSSSHSREGRAALMAGASQFAAGPRGSCDRRWSRGLPVLTKRRVFFSLRLGSGRVVL